MNAPMPRESLENKKKRVLEVISQLKKEYPTAHCALDYTSPLELLVATILSAQCTDERVNLVTKKLFKRCRRAIDYAKIPQEELEELIHSAGFYRNKAKSLKGMGLALVEQHGSQVPKDMQDLIALPGVGRKTANVVLGNAFDIPSGIVVDTHVGRLSRRLGFTKSESPEHIEKDLEKIVPKEHWILFSHWLIWHGRALCKARKAQCALCPIVELCPQVGL